MTGTGRASGAPDLFVARFAAQASRLRPSEAMDAASAALTRMRDVAAGLGASPQSLTTPNVSLRQDYDQQGRPHGFVAEIALVVRTEQVAGAGTLLTQCIEAGGEQARLDGTSFEHADPSALLAAARAAAFADALARAIQLAQLAGRPLGPVLVVDESSGPVSPFPGPEMLRFSRATAADTSLEPGSLEASVTLTVRWSWG